MKPEERANELYPNNSTFCGGVASIARQAYIKGWEESERGLIQMVHELAEAVLFDWDNKADVAREVITALKERKNG